ncbi:MAG: VWA domain-containing protein [Acidobacteriaceae bacterium]
MGLAVGAAQQNGSGSLPDGPTAQNTSQASGGQTSTAESGSQQSVPDAPSATANQGSDNLRNLTRQVAPGKAPAPEGDENQVQAPPPPQTSGQNPDGEPQQEAPYIPKNPEEARGFVLHANTTYIPVPTTVLDKNHHQVSGLTYRDFRIYENGQRQHIAFFSVDPVPLSVAFVIDQSMPKDTMKKVNESLSAIQGAFTPQDEAAVFTYGNGVTKQSTFTATQGDRLPAVLERSKKEGTEMGGPQVGGPFGMTGPTINGKAVDPNVNGNARPGYDFNIPHETHTLSDAILAAAKELQTRPRERRRVIYVISDGKDMRSKASVREVIHFLQGNQVTVYATMVGDAATWGIGYLDRVHLPLIPAENVLPRYANATGGVLEAQLSADGMERSFAIIAKEIRTQYTLGYYSHLPTIDGRYRTLDVHVERPNLEVKARLGYYPTASLQ